MPSSWATVRACASSREPIATTSQRSAFRRPGITLRRPMSAVDRMPQRRFVIVGSPPPGCLADRSDATSKIRWSAAASARAMPSSVPPPRPWTRPGTLRRGAPCNPTRRFRARPLTRQVVGWSVAQHLKERNTKPVTMRLEAVGQRSETVRRSNLSAIVRELHVGGPASRSDLVARTGLTRSAIRGLIGELAAADLVVEERPEPQGTPGRPSPVVRLNPDGAVVLSLEIAVDSLAAAVVGLGGEVFARVRVDRPAGHVAVDAIAEDLAGLAVGLRAGRPPGDHPIGVGVAVVGVVRRSDGFVSLAPNLGWRDVPLGDTLAAALDVEAPISVANDADLGALVEVRRGAAIGVDDVLFVSGEYGVGGGLIVDGRPMTGVAGYGGEDRKSVV